MTETQDHTDTSPPSLTIDWAKYGAMLDEWDGSDEQKQELIETLWSIVMAFVDLGFAVQSSCGETAEMDEIALPDVLSCDLTQPETNKKQELRDAFSEAVGRSPSCR